MPLIFNEIQVRRISRKKHSTTSDALQDTLHCLLPMKARVVQNHHLPSAQIRAQHDAQPQLEQTVMAGAVKTQRRDQTSARLPRRDDRKTLAGMAHASVKARLAAWTPPVFALQAIITAGLIHIHTVAGCYGFERLDPRRALGFVALLITPTLFLRVQPIAPKARENDIRLNDTPFSCCQNKAISPSVACRWRWANSANSSLSNCRVRLERWGGGRSWPLRSRKANQ